jgi:ubiquitin-protein ligase
VIFVSENQFLTFFFFYYLKMAATGGLRGLRKKRKGSTHPLKMSTRSTYILREIGDKGESLDLPDEESAPGHLCYCKLEYPDAKSFGDSVEKYKYFVVHVTVNDGLYKGGTFRIAIDSRSTESYPFQPPKAKMLTKIWHPNFDLEGGICHSHLKLPGPPHNGSWMPGLRLQGLVDGLLLMFDENSVGFNPDDPLNVEAAEQYGQNKSAFNAKARKWVQDYAKPVKIANDDLAVRELG